VANCLHGRWNYAEWAEEQAERERRRAETIRRLSARTRRGKSNNSISEVPVLVCRLIQVGVRYAGRVLPWSYRCGHRHALARLQGQAVLVRSLGILAFLSGPVEMERPSERLRRRFLQAGEGN
jgi:hypothetical protein